MNKETLIGWFENRRKSNVVENARNHAERVVATVTELDNAMVCMDRGNTDDAEKCIQRLMLCEKEADNIEDIVFEELSKGELPPKGREDLMHMIKRADRVADWAKEAARDLKMLIEANIDVPKDIWSMFRKMSHNLEKCSKALKLMIDNLGVDDDAVLKYEHEVDRIEHEIDEIYFDTKKRMISLSIDPRHIIILNDILHAIEESTDDCKNTAGMIHAVVVAGK